VLLFANSNRLFSIDTFIIWSRKTNDLPICTKDRPSLYSIRISVGITRLGVCGDSRDRYQVNEILSRISDGVLKNLKKKMHILIGILCKIKQKILHNVNTSVYNCYMCQSRKYTYIILCCIII